LSDAISSPPVALSIIEIADQMAVANKITSLQHAISYIGLNRLKEIIYLAGIQACKFHTPTFDQSAFWKDSYVAGLVAEYLAKKWLPDEKEKIEQAYFAASLANIGKLVSAFLFPEPLGDVVQTLNTPGCNQLWSELEEEHNLPDHTVLGEIAGVLWGLPFYAIRTIRFHNVTPEEFREDSQGEVVMFGDADNLDQDDEKISLHDIVCISLQYTHWISGSPYRINQLVLDKFLQKLGFDEKAKDSLGTELSDYYRSALNSTKGG